VAAPLEQIAAVISHLHDGRVTAFALEGSTLSLRVAIRYLAERIDPAYAFLTVHLDGAREIRFRPWWDDADREQSLSDLRLIFRSQKPPEILSAAPAGDRLKILLNCPEPHLGYCGGELTLLANGVQVVDPSGKSISGAELATIRDEYWTEFAKRGLN
jgi:hypothetical protein